MTSLAMQWVQQQLGHLFYGNTHGQPGVPCSSSSEGREGWPGLSGSAVFCCPSPPGAGHGLAPSLSGAAAPAQLPHRAAKTRGGEPLLEIEGFMGTGIPRNLGWLLPCALWSLPSQG